MDCHKNGVRVIQNFLNIAVFAALLGGCGFLPPAPPLPPGLGQDAGQPPPATTAPASAPPPPSAPAAAPSNPASPTGSAPDALTVTLLSPRSIPSRLDEFELNVRFQANAADAVFECRVGANADAVLAWQACGGNGYNFGRLAQGQSYSLRVRARTPDGRKTNEDLTISFVVDHARGTPATAVPGEAVAIVPGSARELPTPGSADTAVRVLQAGDYFAVNIPSAAFIDSFSTSQTVSGGVHYLRRRQTGPAVGLQSDCSANYERPVAAGDGSTYCDSTPSASMLSRVLIAVPATDHVLFSVPDLTMGAKPGAVAERLLVAAYPSTAAFGFGSDLSAAGLGLSCQGAAQHGQLNIDIVPTFYHLARRPAAVSWCQVRDQLGGWWWLATLQASLTSSGAGQLQVVYAVNAEQGIVGSPQFLTRVNDRLGALLLPIRPDAVAPPQL